MLKKIIDFLAGWVMTIIGGIFLIASFILPRMGYPEGEKLAWVCVIICGIPLLYLAIYRLIYNKGISKISSCLLISLAMAAALYIGDLFAAGEVVFIMEIGALFEDMTTNRARKGLRDIMSLAPKTGRVIREGEAVIVPASEIVRGDIIRILPGEVIPADGIIVEGATSVDESIMTGESLPVDRLKGDQVFSGTMNCFGSFDMEVTGAGADSSIQKLIQMVTEAGKSEAPTQRIADKWASYLVPVALLIAVIAYFITGDIVRAVTVMVVFCPCALVLSTPTAIVAAVGQAAKNGVIIMSGEALEKLSHVDTVAFDKTGTLTYGRLDISGIFSFTDINNEELLRLSASGEALSEHPLGKAITGKAQEEGLSLLKATDFKMTAGKGISAAIDEKLYLFGSEKFIIENGLAIGEEAGAAINSCHDRGWASVVIADSERVIGVIALSDTIREESAKVVGDLSRMGVKSVLLTGDNKRAATHLSKEIGITEIRSELLPEEKVQNIEDLRKEGLVAMVGDGVNDAPALKTADVGIAMGVMGSDIAVNAADVALMTDNIEKLPYLKWLSKVTVNTIKTAITISMCINFVAIILSVTGVLTPTTGALVHNAGSCFVVLLAALLYDRKFEN